MDLRYILVYILTDFENMKDKKKENGYFILFLFIVFGILSVISIPGIILGTTMSLNDINAENYFYELLKGIVFSVTVFYFVPIILTIIQFFRNKELFAIQVFFIFTSITALVAVTLSLCRAGI